VIGKPSEGSESSCSPADQDFNIEEEEADPQQEEEVKVKVEEPKIDLASLERLRTDDKE
jgi:hypothetical protein